jgi:hypothetical protein
LEETGETVDGVQYAKLVKTTFSEAAFEPD